MSQLDRRPFFFALLVSLLLHWLVLEAPGWRVPENPALPESEPLDARLRVLAPTLPLSPAITPRKPDTRRVPSASPSPRRKKPGSPVSQSLPLSLPQAAPVDAVQAGERESSPQLSTADAASGSSSFADEHASVVADEKPKAVAGRFDLPRRGSVRFLVMRGDRGLVVGQSVHHWNHDGKSYVLNSVTETTGLIALFKPVRAVWVSQGEIGPDGLIPHEFQAEKDGVRGDSASFDWPGTVLTLSGGPQRTVKLMPGTQDVLSMFYQLGSMLPALLLHPEGQVAAKEGFGLPVTTGRKLEVYRFQRVGEEALSLNRLGEQRALHLRVAAGEQTIDLWLGESLRGLPLKIRYTDGKGDSFDQVADNIEFEEGKGP